MALDLMYLIQSVDYSDKFYKVQSYILPYILNQNQPNQPLPFYRYNHPAISPNGHYLYFSSDMPGGYGGKDIWRVPVSNSGFGAVENLGDIKPNLKGTTKKKVVSFNGEQRLFMELCKEFNINYQTLRSRLNKGMTIEEAISKEVRSKRTNIV